MNLLLCIYIYIYVLSRYNFGMNAAIAYIIAKVQYQQDSFDDIQIVINMQRKVI